MFEKLKEWAKMSEKEQLSLLIGLIIVVLGSVIWKQHSDCMGMRKDYRNEKRELQDKIDKQKDTHLEYLRAMDMEYRMLLRELNNLKNEKQDI